MRAKDSYGPTGTVREDDSSPGEGGSATVPAAMLTLAVLAVCWLGVQFGAVVVAGHRARGAADLAALAAAAYAPEGQWVACSRAAEVTRRMNLELSDCRVRGRRAWVHTELAVPGAPQGAWLVTGRALAGPIEGRGAAQE
ncbi:helicase/secretion neighborhood TadE-like protein [Actinopolyspora xinjiangensis]|uniref:Helicase/secretion neighborhood TadE-like protein n=1 Tax=Actinopolyspora xinjiangensis TaxID=405564 RepID=A0A1H0WWW5_9ACTN|nr:Rv3654c family TadE-like protein [Actinopolyspora xinjiangensis]SDP95238.1 helicase/secretion neighborhood TadE-like protein [Actinopolyspora xinjiangensis]